ncbi:MAG: hypothetical protein AAGC88_12710 [Bacteroidota bacterium]
MKHLYVISILLLSMPLTAADITSSSSGIWNFAGTWDTGIPTATDNVIIDAGDTVTLDISPSIVDLTINEGAVLDLSSFNITVPIIYAGSMQTIKTPASNTFQNLTLIWSGKVLSHPIGRAWRVNRIVLAL